MNTKFFLYILTTLTGPALAHDVNPIVREALMERLQNAQDKSALNDLKAYVKETHAEQHHESTSSAVSKKPCAKQAFLKKRPLLRELITTAFPAIFIFSIALFLARREGYREGKNDGYRLGYIKGHSAGCENLGYKEGQEDGYRAGHVKGYDAGYVGGHNVGYKEGFDDGFNAPRIVAVPLPEFNAFLNSRESDSDETSSEAETDGEI